MLERVMLFESTSRDKMQQQNLHAHAFSKERKKKLKINAPKVVRI
jgi:hypothetical protein